MNKTILIAGIACLSVVAVAQSNSDKKSEPAATAPKRGISSPTGGDRITSPRDLASGQASGKVAVSHEISSPRDISTGQSTGRRVAAADVNGDGAADQANAKSSAHAVENVSADSANSKASVHASAQPAAVQAPKEVSTGKATGGISAHDDWEAPKAKVAAPGTAAPAPSSNPQEQRMHKPMTVTK
jgi:hypothetical protein